MRRTTSLALAVATIAGALAMAGGVSQPAAAQAVPSPPLPPKAQCGPGSLPETGRQGRVTLEDVNSGRAAKGYSCNMEQLSHFGATGGYKVERYVDAAGHECAYFDSTLLFPINVPTGGTDLTGVYVLDMSNPAKPVKTANLLTPAMQTPHESMALNQKRGLIGAVTANPIFYPGIVDMYDVTKDCRNPALQSSAPVGILGHEGNWAPDGKTYYAASLDGGTLTAVDATNPLVPVPLWTGRYNSHGLSLSDDGKRAYLAARRGLIILDTTQVQDRVPNPVVSVVSTLTWPTVSTPQYTIPVTIQGHPYLIEIDEFGSADKIGAARIIDIADDTKPFVVSDIRLEVNQAEYQQDQAGDPQAENSLSGYNGHYCDVPKRMEPGIVACTFILSGLRVFDIRDPFAPKEIAYYNAPIQPSRIPGQPGASYAMSKPTFAPERGEIWYSDGNSGFYALRVTNGVWPFTSASPAVNSNAAAAASPAAAAGGGRAPGVLPATGGVIPLLALAAALLAALGLLRVRRRTQN